MMKKSQKSKLNFEEGVVSPADAGEAMCNLKKIASYIKANRDDKECRTKKKKVGNTRNNKLKKSKSNTSPNMTLYLNELEILKKEVLAYLYHFQLNYDFDYYLTKSRSQLNGVNDQTLNLALRTYDIYSENKNDVSAKNLRKLKKRIDAHKDRFNNAKKNWKIREPIKLKKVEEDNLYSRKLAPGACRRSNADMETMHADARRYLYVNCSDRAFVRKDPYEINVLKEEYDETPY